MSKFLVVFDFDFTLVNENTDSYIKKLSPACPKYNSNEGWNSHMQKVFSSLHLSGVTPQEIRSCLEEIPLTDGMPQLLTYLKSIPVFESIIISDANAFFINHLLSYFNYRNVFEDIFTNPAEFNDMGCLILNPHQDQSCCNRCPKHMCKSLSLDNYLTKKRKEDKSFERVFYVGDGRNDVCPALSLNENDLIFPRAGFTMHKLLNSYQDDPSSPSQVKGTVLPWNNGSDILESIQKFCFL